MIPVTSLTDRKNAAISRGVGMTTQIYADRAENSEIWDKEGNRYIDFAAGIAVVNTGHRHPRVIEAVKKQLDRFTHTCHQVVPYENYVELAERLNAILPGDFAKKTIFVTTGAEAVENAVKIARAATGRQAVVAFGGGFHGRTFMGMALTGKVVPYKVGFGAMPADVFHVPFPVELQGVSAEQSLAALKRLFAADVDPNRVAAIIIEPVQGEGGFYPVPTSFIKAIREICDQHGILLIADEVQTGFARTGKLFAMEHHGVAADLVTMAKGLDIIEDEKLCERAEQLGGRLKQRLAAIAEQTPEIVDIRGPGFMNAVEFNDVKTNLPSADFANRVRLIALEKGLILLTCGVHGNVIRFLAPITIQDNVFAEAMDILEASILEARA
jgi:4-aminobutyrate aminotransferase